MNWLLLQLYILVNCILINYILSNYIFINYILINNTLNGYILSNDIFICFILIRYILIRYTLTRKSPLSKRESSHLGIPKEMSAKLIGSHWTMTIWSDGEDSWGFHFVCQELPEMNCIDNVTAGVEKTVDNPIFGGKSKVWFILFLFFFTFQTHRLCITCHLRVAKGLCWVKTINNQLPSSIRCRGSNSQFLDHEPPAVTTRPLLHAQRLVYYLLPMFSSKIKKGRKKTLRVLCFLKKSLWWPYLKHFFVMVKCHKEKYFKLIKCTSL